MNEGCIAWHGAWALPGGLAIDTSAGSRGRFVKLTTKASPRSTSSVFAVATEQQLGPVVLLRV